MAGNSSAPPTSDATREGSKSTHPLSGAPASSAEARSFGLDQGSDDLLGSLLTNWQKIVGALVVTLLVVWLVQEYRQAQIRKTEEASQRFDMLQASFAAKLPALTEPSDGKAPAQQAASDPLSDNAALLTEKFDSTVYGELAPLYEVQAAIAEREFERANDLLSGYSTSRFLGEQGRPSQDKTIKPKEFADELAALLTVRLMIAEGADASLGEARRALSNLSERGQFTNVAALSLLAQLSNSKETQDFAAQQAQKVIGLRPELSESIARELSQHGVRLSDEPSLIPAV